MALRKASVRELHIHTSRLVREAAEGDIIVIENRGEPVAELRSITKTAGISAAKTAKIFDRHGKDLGPDAAGQRQH